MHRNVLLFVFCISSYGVSAQNWDINTLKSVNIHRDKSLDKAFDGISKSVKPLVIAAPLMSLANGFLIQKDSISKVNAINLTIAVGGNATITYITKKIVQRERPYDRYPELDPYNMEHSYSFPSGHTSNAFALATSLSMTYKKWYVVVPAYTWAASVAYSRMHLGVHYPSDVMAGAVLGAGSAILSHKATNWLQKKYTLKKAQK